MEAHGRIVELFTTWFFITGSMKGVQRFDEVFILIDAKFLAD